MQTALGSKSQPPLDNHTKMQWFVRYCDSEQKVAIAVAELETGANFPGNSPVSGSGGADSGAVAAQSGVVDASLARIVDAWPALPAAVKKAVVRLIENLGHVSATD